MPLDFKEILRAWPIVHRHLPRTPLYRYSLLSARLGFDAYVKHENHLPTGAFKIRGGINLFSNMTDAQRAHGVIAATRGNHGLSLAYAAREFGSRAVIYVPTGNNPEKIAIMESLGAEVVVHGSDFDAALAEAEARAKNASMRYAHPANEPLLIAGVGTIALELVEDLPDIDVVIAPIGGGSLISGLVLGLRTLRPDVKIIGVQAERAAALTQSLKAGRIIELESADTFADGLATRCTFELPYRLVREDLDETVLVTEDEMKEAVRAALEATHNVAEGAAAASYAAAYKLRSQLARKRVAIIHSGQNIDRNTLRWALGMFDA